MQQALHSGSGGEESVADPSPRTSRIDRFLVAQCRRNGCRRHGDEPGGADADEPPRCMRLKWRILGGCRRPACLLQNFFTEDTGELGVPGDQRDERIAGPRGGVHRPRCRGATGDAWPAQATLKRPWQRSSRTRRSPARPSRRSFAPDNPDTTRVDGRRFYGPRAGAGDSSNNAPPNVTAYDTPTQGTTPGYHLVTAMRCRVCSRSHSSSSSTGSSRTSCGRATVYPVNDLATPVRGGLPSRSEH